MRNKRLQMRLLGLATWPYHWSPFLQDTMAIKKQKRCRKIRPVSAFISESSASILMSSRSLHPSQALVPFFFNCLSNLLSPCVSC